MMNWNKIFWWTNCVFICCGLKEAQCQFKLSYVKLAHLTAQFGPVKPRLSCHHGVRQSFHLK